jgi:DNA-binding transcriptional MerR regulator
MPKLHPALALIEWYDTKDVSRISGLTTAMINYLCRYGIVKPSGSKDRGRGTARKYLYADILLLRVIAKLLAQGISVMRLRKSLAALQKRGVHTSELVSRRYVLTDGYNLYFQDKATLEQLDSGQLTFAFVLQLTALRAEVDTSLARYYKTA